MQTRTLGRTGLEVSQLGYGTAVSRAYDEHQWGRMLNAALDAGINLIDTSNDYGLGFARSTEEMIGQHIAHRRSEYVLATKCGCSSEGHVWTRENLFRGLHESLERMRTDYIDVMQLHGPTPEECQRGRLVEALEEIRGQGKVRWIGVSTDPPHADTFIGWGVFDVYQLPYSALERRYEDWISKASGTGGGTIIRSGVARQDGPSEVDRWKVFGDAELDVLRGGDSVSGFMLRFTLSHPEVHTIIVGTMDPDHLAENVATAAKGPLPREVYAEAKDRLAASGSKPESVTPR
jgi:aryl-alcohol dehydrogenase-like predicted oxidoreductase